MLCKNRCSLKAVHSKTPVLESLFNKIVGLKLQHRGVFSCKYCKICKNTYFEKYMRMAASDFSPRFSRI